MSDSVDKNPGHKLNSLKSMLKSFDTDLLTISKCNG